MRMRLLVYGMVLLLSACTEQKNKGADLTPVLNFVGRVWKAFSEVPVADGLDYPLGPPDGKGYYNAQPFGGNSGHLGDDWNGVGGGNSDLGDTIFSIGTGKVFFSKDIGGGWGNVVRMVHNIGTHLDPVWVESLYAHMDTVWVNQGAILKRGDPLGTVGTAGGIYLAHLHLEIRSQVGLPIGGGYGTEIEGWEDPSAYIQSHRPRLEGEK